MQNPVRDQGEVDDDVAETGEATGRGRLPSHASDDCFAALHYFVLHKSEQDKSSKTARIRPPAQFLRLTNA